jgi:predicted DNA-binding transcriptional regulator AlpA
MKDRTEVDQVFHENQWVPWATVAGWLSVGRNGFRALLKQGLPRVMLNQRVMRFRKSDVEAWLSRKSA